MLSFGSQDSPHLLLPSSSCSRSPNSFITLITRPKVHHSPRFLRYTRLQSIPPLATICPIPLPLLQPYLLTLDVFQHLDTLALEPPLQRPNLSVSICLFRRRRQKGFKTCCRSSFVPEVGLYYEWGGKSSFVLFTVRMLLVAVRFLFSLSGLVSVVSKTHFEVISFSSLPSVVESYSSLPLPPSLFRSSLLVTCTSVFYSPLTPSSYLFTFHSSLSLFP